MKKFTLIIASMLVAVVLSGSQIVNAQATEDITLDDLPSDFSSLDVDTAEAADTTTDTTETAAVPDTGFAPTENKVLASSMVFIGGAALGGALGFGLIQLKKKSQN